MGVVGDEINIRISRMVNKKQQQMGVVGDEINIRISRMLKKIGNSQNH